MAKSKYCETCPEVFVCKLRKNFERYPSEYAVQLAMCRIERDARKQGNKNGNKKNC